MIECTFADDFFKLPLTPSHGWKDRISENIVCISEFLTENLNNL